MKKIIIFLVLAASILALTPIVGNKIVKEKLDDEIMILNSYGVEVLKTSEDSSYLSTSRHYEFVLSDSDKFLNYMKKYSNMEFSHDASVFLSGGVFGADLKYSNIPFSKALSLDMYPVKFPALIMSEIKKSDEGFYNYIESFLEKKGIYYHLEYDIISEDFRGYLKDIDENHTLKNGSKFLVNVTDATFSGKGSLVAPKYFISDIKKVATKFLNDSKEISITLKNLISKLNFVSRNTYDSEIELKSLFLDSKTKSAKDTSIRISGLSAALSSSTNGTKAKINSKSSFSEFKIISDELNMNASNFNYDVAFSEIDKDSLEELRVLISKAKTQNSLRAFAKITQSSLNMLSKGLKISVFDFSVKNINLDGDDLKALSIKSQLDLKEDKDLANKVNYSPLFIAGNLDMDFNLKLSKKIYSKISSAQPIAIIAYGYAKESGDDLVFDVTLKSGELKINGKSL